MSINELLMIDDSLPNEYMRLMIQSNNWMKSLVCELDQTAYDSFTDIKEQLVHESHISTRKHSQNISLQCFRMTNADIHEPKQKINNIKTHPILRKPWINKNPFSISTPTIQYNTTTECDASHTPTLQMSPVSNIKQKRLWGIQDICKQRFSWYVWD